MKITIIGAGNIGSVLGSVLTEKGQDVTLLELRDELVEAVRKEGIRIDLSTGGTKNIRVKITSDPNTLGVPDLVIICTKGYSTASALAGVVPNTGSHTCFMSVQNGAGNIENIADIVKDKSRVIGGIFYSIVTPVTFNHLVWTTGLGPLKIGSMNGNMNPMLQIIADAFKGSEIEVVITDRIQDAIWSKVLLNINAGVATALHITNDEFLNYPSAIKMITSIVNELIQVAKAKGINLDHPEDPIQATMEAMQKFRDSGKKPKCSMYQDIENGRKTEIDSIHGSIVREGKKYGIPTPSAEFLVNTIHALEEINAWKKDHQ